MDNDSLSKIISYALRHQPELYGLCLDEKGFIDLERLIHAISVTSTEWENITRDDIINMISVSTKKRHEIIDDKIRAIYGHSRDHVVTRNAVAPPRYLFHGTSRKNAEMILLHGLCAMKRSNVHMSSEPSIALQTGKRKDHFPVVLVINAHEAYLSNVMFYYGNGDVWLADYVPAEYISMYESNDYQGVDQTSENKGAET